MKQSGVYILQSTKNGSYYIGSTDDVATRINYHNNGRVRATRNIRPLIILMFIPCKDTAEARRAEYRLKKYKRRDIIEKVIKDGIFPWEYN